MRPEPAARALNAVIRDLMAMPDGATYVAGRCGPSTCTMTWASTIRWRDAAPRHSIRPRTTAAILLDFHADPLLADVARSYGDRMTYVTEGGREATDASALLVPPDGIVAWACDGRPDVAELRHAAARWLGVPGHRLA